MKDFIGVYPDAVDPKLCDWLISTIDQSSVVSPESKQLVIDNSTAWRNDIQLILNTHLPNYYLNLANVKKSKVKYSVLMNKLLKYNNSKKYYNDMEFKIPKYIKMNYFNEIIKFSKYLDNKKNTDKIMKIKEFFEKNNIDFKKLSKYLNI